VTEPRVLVRRDRRGRITYLKPNITKAVGVLAWVGSVFVALGSLEIVLAWWPPFLGNQEWEFGTYSATVDSLSLLLLGVGLLLAVGIALGQALRLRIVAGIAAVSGGLLLVGLLLYVVDVPVALGSVTDAVARTALKKAIAKSLVQGVVYAGAFLACAAMAWRQARRATSAGDTEGA
jgi:phosphotransferase system  glucose/maltose/N-acetylglucosamine-specific IIC component